jgi:hypothetical protein
MMAKRKLMWRARKLLVLAALLATACGDGNDPLDPEEDPALAPFVGEWTALSMVVASTANPDVAPDLIQEGATFDLNVQSSGQYTASLIFQQQVSTEIGFISVSGNVVTLSREFPTKSTSTATYLFQGGLLILDGDTEFDFNLDGTPEPARAHFELQRR